MENQLLQRITLNPNICHGKPCLRGLHYPVEFILELLSAGMSSENILADYDDLELDDILAALLFATHLTQVKSIYKVLCSLIELSHDAIIVHQ
jgi:uncharacterized protein (DUF433 family)